MRSKKQSELLGQSARLGAIALACVLATGCASVQPVALAPQDMQAQQQKDTEAMRKDVAPIHGPLTLNEAMARALKYNLDRRAKMMEEALAMGQLDVAKFDMLPKLMAQAGYAYRDRMRYTHSSPYRACPEFCVNGADIKYRRGDLRTRW